MLGQHADEEGIKRSKVGSVAKRMDVWPPKRQGKQRRNDGPQPGGTVSLHKPDAEEDHRRGDTLHFHGPHDRVDIGADHEHVQNHVAGSEVTFVGHIDSEPLMQCREQGNDSNGGREKPKNASALASRDRGRTKPLMTKNPTTAPVPLESPLRPPNTTASQPALGASENWPQTWAATTVRAAIPRKDSSRGMKPILAP